MRKTRLEQREETRRRLLDAAGRVFARFGFDGTTIDAIADEAGYSRGAFYSNFDSKDDLFLALIQEHLAAEISTLRAGLDRVDRAEDVAPAIEHRYRVLGEDSTWCLLTTEFQLYTMRGGRKSVEFAGIYERYRQELGQLIGDQFRRLDITSELTPYEMGVAQVALSHGLALQRVASSAIDPSLTPRAMALFAKGAMVAVGSGEPRTLADPTRTPRSV